MAVNYYTDNSDYKFKGKAKTTSWINQSIVNEELKPGAISIIFCDSERHIEINRQYLGHDYYTDVITFDYGIGANGTQADGQSTVSPDGGICQGARPAVSGDIFIDRQTVGLNAETYGVEPHQEMMRVIIHGILHLCGYKDKSPQDEKKMREKENFYLEFLKNQTK